MSIDAEQEALKAFTTTEDTTLALDTISFESLFSDAVNIDGTAGGSITFTGY